jgi:tetratricopeptide (TPR) repeat protein
MLRHIALAATLILPLAACKKKGDGGDDQTEEPGDDAESNDGPVEPDVPQEPDPPEIATARTAYLLGNYADVTGTMGPIYEDLVARKQYRAGGLAGAWLALAHARDVVENGEAPANHAAAMGDRTGDDEVVCAGNMALGAIALGLEDFEGAIKALEKAVDAGDAPPADNALARSMLAEALIGRAYGAGGGSKLQNPADLDAARAAYEAAITPASGVAESDMLLGRIHEGLAAIAKYQGKRDDICTNAKLASEKYAAAGVSDYLKEGPDMLAQAARCPE